MTLFCNCLLRDEIRAEDISHDVFLQIPENPDSLNPDKSFIGYLQTIARNLNLIKTANFLKGIPDELPFPSCYVASDLYKVMEGVAYLLILERDDALEQQMGSIIEYIADAQKEDGYHYETHSLKKASRSMQPTSIRDANCSKTWRLCRFWDFLAGAASETVSCMASILRFNEIFVHKCRNRKISRKFAAFN